MMSDFVERVRKSGLVDDTKLDSALTQLGDSSRDPLQIARHLIRNALLTPWQCQQLLDGRYKGFLLGKYKLLEQLGRGGMSMVFVAEHIGMQRKVALKVLPKSRMRDGSFVERFCREARASAALNHPNIVRAYDFDRQDDTYFLVMEWIEGQNLQELVAAEHPLPFQRITRLIAAAARGLQHAHDSGLVHRDIKPANILVDSQDQAKILDLGLAMWADNDESSVTLENNERVLGTADYLAPEQALNCHEVDHRADIYALGGTLYYALTGQPPYPVGSIAQKIAQHQSAAPPDPRTVRTDCPDALGRLCQEMMRKTPETRTRSAGEVATRLQACLDGGGGRGGSAEAPADFVWSQLAAVSCSAPAVDQKTTRHQSEDDDFRIGEEPEPVRIVFKDEVSRRHGPLGTGRRRRRGLPWWLWLSMAGLLAAAGWMWQQLPRTP